LGFSTPPGPAAVRRAPQGIVKLKHRKLARKPREEPMIKAMTYFLLPAALLAYNARLLVEGQGVLVREQVLDSEWKRACDYYYPVRLIHLRTPIQFQCSPRAPV
jgi:hypothetical protein